MTIGMPVATPRHEHAGGEQRDPDAKARAGPRRSASDPASVMPMMFVSQNALKAQP